MQTGISVVKLLADSGLCSSNSDARRLIRAGGAYLGDTRVEDEKRVVSLADLRSETMLLRAGKKNLRRIVVQQPS
jgi:tyrosyl-tRNA synthetase